MALEQNFAVYAGRAVVVEKIIGDRARIRYIERGLVVTEEEVNVSELTELTEALANKIIYDYQSRIRAFQECLRYI